MLSRSAAAAPVKRRAPARVLPGFKITLGYTLMYLCLIVLIPLSALVFKTFTLTWDQFWDAVTGPRVMASYRLTFGASLIAALVNVVFGLLVAWVLVRYQFFGKKIVDALVDLPFALPTAVAGISLTALLAGNGWVGQYLEPMGIQLAFNANGIVIALIFIGLPFVVRTVQPVLEDVWALHVGKLLRALFFLLLPQPCLQALPWPLHGPLGNTAPSFSLRATCP